MLARTIAADNQGNVVVETNRAGCFVARSIDRKLEVNDYFGGPFDSFQGSEIEVLPLPPDSRCPSFKLSSVKEVADAGQALEDLQSNPAAGKIRIRVPPYQHPDSQ